MPFWHRETDMVSAKPYMLLMAARPGFLHKMGEYTQQIRNPDSWEGWYWGAKHVWGTAMIGMMAPICQYY